MKPSHAWKAIAIPPLIFANISHVNTNKSGLHYLDEPSPSHSSFCVSRYHFLKCKLLGLHFKIEINEITGVNQKEVLLSSGLKPD